MTVSHFWLSQTFWTAIAALATIGYLVASYMLWRTTKETVRATKDLVRLTEQTARASDEQAAVAREQFELAKQAFLSDHRPLVYFVEGAISDFRGGVGYECHFQLRNIGRLPARDLKWTIAITVQGGTLQTLAMTERTIQLVPGATWPVKVQLLEDWFLRSVGTNGVFGAFIRVSYSHPVNKAEYGSCLKLERDEWGQSHQTSTDLT